MLANICASLNSCSFSTNLRGLKTPRNFILVRECKSNRLFGASEICATSLHAAHGTCLSSQEHHKASQFWIIS